MLLDFSTEAQAQQSVRSRLCMVDVTNNGNKLSRLHQFGRLAYKPDHAAIVQAHANCADGIAGALREDLLHVGTVLDDTAVLLKTSRQLLRNPPNTALWHAAGVISVRSCEEDCYVLCMRQAS